MLNLIPDPAKPSPKSHRYVWFCTNFSSYLTNRTFCVAANQIMSDSVPVSCGVLHGSVLGPFLLVLYVTPLSQIIQQFRNVSYLFFADDIQIYHLFSESNFHLFTSVLECLVD